ncbi:MAG TPA: DoxX family protein [Rhodocyclaceae bacterium]|nr:DoxX family protein [Rhodocyclaceae bacterium]
MESTFDLKAALARLLGLLDCAGDWVGLLCLRLIVGYEFLDSGLVKFRGDNWFADIQDQFPFPFNVIPPDISWQMSMWFEILGGVAIILGLGTRFFAASLVVVTVVAIAAVHWPAEWHTLAELAQGYVLTDDGYGNYKLPLILLVMLLPLIFQGPGKLGFDHWIRRAWLGKPR